MSYILEALEKSENERKQRNVPDLQTQHTLYPGVTRSKPRRLKRNVRRLRPAVLITCGLMLLAWLFRDHMPVALEIKITQSNAITEKSALPDPVLQEKQVLASPEPVSKIEQEKAETKPAPAITQQQTLESTPSTDATHDTVEMKHEEAAEQVPVTVSNQAETTVIRKAITLEPAPIILAENKIAKMNATFTPLPFLEELPASVKSNLPKLKFAGHTYSSIPGDRLIIINSNIRREGDPVEPGLRLEEITWDGVILNFRDIRFQVITTN